MFPKIELHVHLEGTIRTGTLLQIARRNNVPMPAGSVERLAALYEFRDFAHFLEVWRLTTAALRTEQDLRQVVVDYAAEAAGHGAVYLEGIFTPAEPVRHGARWDEVFSGYCDDAQQAAELTARYAVAYRDRGVVGLGGLGSVPHAGEVAIPAWSPTWSAAAWCSMCARSRTCAPARSPRWPSTSCRSWWRPAWPVRFPPTTLPCSEPT